SFTGVTLGDGAQLQALPGGSTTILVAGALATGSLAQVFPLLQPANQLTISVAGSDGTTGAQPAASIGKGTQITALLNAPRGTLSLGDDVFATGAFGGFALTAGSNVTLVFQGGFPPASQQPAGQQALSRSFLPAVATSPLVGALPGSTVLSLRFVLPLQVNGAAGSGFPPLTTFIDSLSSSKPPAPLTPTTFAAAYGPSAADYNSVSSFATANGLAVTRTFESRAQLSVSGTAAAIENAFFVNLDVYQRADGSTFYAPSNPPSADLATRIVGVVGLDSFSQPLRTQVMFPANPPPLPFASGIGSTNLPCTTSPNVGGDGFFGADIVGA
ncbi:MAG: protease pro-enzyme activation domain-containing protein, partial [Polyangiaceae bacterium]